MLLPTGLFVNAVASPTAVRYTFAIARPPVVLRAVGMLFRGATLLPPKQPVRFAGVVTTPFVITGATQVFAALFGSRSTPSSAVPTVPSGPRRRKEKSPFNSASDGTVRRCAAERRRMYFHSWPPKKNSLSLTIGPPML